MQNEQESGYANTYAVSRSATTVMRLRRLILIIPIHKRSSRLNPNNMPVNLKLTATSAKNLRLFTSLMFLPHLQKHRLFKILKQF